MTEKILVSTQMMIHEQTRFREKLEGLGLEVDFLMNEQNVTEAECLRIEPKYSGWIAGDDEITASVLDHMSPNLKVISKWGTGLDSINIEYAKTKGISVKNSPGAFAEAVGEMAVAYLLALSREVIKTDREVRDGNWPKVQMKTLSEMKVGIVGLGAIGESAARYISALGGTIHYFDPFVVSEEFERLDDIGLLFNASDAVVITTSLTKETRGLVNKDVISKAGSGVLLVNVSRGPVIVEDDLVWGLETGLILSAALDVFEKEPVPKDSRLITFKNVIFGSHNANNTAKAVEFVHANTIDQLHSSLLSKN